MQFRHKPARGFTMVELMVALGVLGLLLMLAVPSFRDAGLPSQLRATANNLVAATQLARSEAIKRNRSITLCVANAAGTACTTGNWNQGWLVRDPTLTSPDDVLQRELPAPTGYRVTAGGGATTLTFQPTGLGATSQTFTVCRSTPTVGAEERSVTITATGRASVTKTTAGACP